MLKYQYSACKIIIFFYLSAVYVFFPTLYFKETWFCPQQLIYIEQYSKEETPITYVVITGAEPLRARGGVLRIFVIRYGGRPVIFSRIFNCTNDNSHRICYSANIGDHSVSLNHCSSRCLSEGCQLMIMFSSPLIIS